MATLFNTMLLNNGITSILSLNPTLWLDGADSSTMTKSYVNLVETGSGTSGTTTITTSATVANKIQPGMILRIGGTDTYTVSTVSTVTVTTVQTLTTSYSLGSVLALDRISQWNDKSVNGNNVTQSTALLRPVYYPSAKNGRSAVTFDGFSSFDLPAGVLAVPTGNNTTFAITQRTGSVAPNPRIISINKTGAGSDRYFLRYDFPAVNEVSFLSRSSDSPEVINTGIVDANYSILTGLRSGTLQSLAINNNAAQTNSSGADASGLTDGQIGSANSSQHLVGNIAELIVFSTALTTQQIAGVLAILNNKWSIY